MKYPGIKSKPFKIIFKRDWFTTPNLLKRILPKWYKDLVDRINLN